MEIGARTRPLGDEADRAFIVGAPRCGTTAIAKWLRGHPQVCLSRPKEPHYFAINDLRGLATPELRDTVERDYVQRYFQHRGRSSLLAEGSVSYLYAPERLEPVLRLWPAAKFIVCLRNPLAMVASLHQRNFVNGDETVRDFAKAWSLVPERRAGRSIPRSCLDPRLLDYWEAGQLGKHLQKFVETVGGERCLTILFDDLQADPRREYRAVLQFLGLPDDHKSEFERHADSKTCRLPRLQRLLQRPPRFALGFLDSDDLHNPRFAETAGPLMQRLVALRSRLLDWNEIPAEPQPLPPTVLEQMRAMFRDDVGLLSELLGRDLGHWIDGDRQSQADFDSTFEERKLAARG